MTTIDRDTRPSSTAIAGLLDDLEQLRRRLVKDGDLLWSRTSDWVKPVMPAKGERGGGTAEPSDRDLQDRLMDRAASRYHAEVKATIDRMRQDGARLVRLMEIVNPAPAVTLKAGQMQLAQVASEGWCVSCWRNDRKCEPIAKRPTGEPYYKDLCRGCGEWKAEHGQVPPLAILVLRHNGRRVSTKDVAKAIEKK